MADHRIRISVTDEEYALVDYQARSRGLSVSAYLKHALFAYITKYPAKGVLAEIHKNTNNGGLETP